MSGSDTYRVSVAPLRGPPWGRFGWIEVSVTGMPPLILARYRFLVYAALLLIAMGLARLGRLAG